MMRVVKTDGEGEGEGREEMVDGGVVLHYLRIEVLHIFCHVILDLQPPEQFEEGCARGVRICILTFRLLVPI